MRHYHTPTFDHAKPEPRHRFCKVWGDDGNLVKISLQQRGKDNFAVRYGMEVHADLTYSQACAKLGSALMHFLSCEGLVDNREKGET